MIDLVSILLNDVSEAQIRLKLTDTDANRRDVIRTIFAAVDGMVFLYREFVRDALEQMEMLTDAERVVLSEKALFVSDKGKIFEQTKHLSTAAAIRLVSRMAHRANPEFEINFENDRWARFKLAIQIRNRITHPKSVANMHVSTQDLEHVQSSFYWLMDAILSSMQASTSAMSDFVSGIGGVVDQLKAGDPETWELYRVASSNVSSD